MTKELFAISYVNSWKRGEICNLVLLIYLRKGVLVLTHPSGQNRQKGTQNTVPYCQKYTPTDFFFRNFAHWDRIFIMIHQFFVYLPRQTNHSLRVSG